MATRSTIAIEKQDGTVEAIYCHWDGYVSHNGELLFQHYSNAENLQALIDLGDLSILQSEIGDANNWDAPTRGICLFYGRDRLDTLGTGKAKFKDFAEYKRYNSHQQYNYILRANGVWLVNGSILQDCLECTE